MRVYIIRGTAVLKVALDHFLLKGGQQNRAGGQILSVIFHFYQRFSFITSNQSLTTDPVESMSLQGSRRKRHLAGLFFTGFFLSCVHVSPIKTKIGGRTNIFTGMKPLKTSYILLKREEPIKAFYTLFM